MINFSRTTLRELKKRYLNILKKSLLINLTLLVAYPVLAETSRQESIIATLKNPTDKVEITKEEDITLQFEGLNTFGSMDLEITTENKVRANGSMIQNSGSLSFDGNAEILIRQNKIEAKENYIYPQGGFLSNKGTFQTGEETKISFIDNQVITKGSPSNINGSIFYNNSGATIQLGGESLFKNNKGMSDKDGVYGSILSNRGSFIFQKKAVFENNTILGPQSQSINGSAQGGALYNNAGGTITFSDTAEFIHNKAISNTTGKVEGGAIFNTNKSFMNFNGGFLFSANEALNLKSDQIRGPDIYNKESTINFSFNTTDDKEVIGSLDGGIYNEGTRSNNGIITKNGSGILILGDSMQNTYTTNTKFTQTAGTTIASNQSFSIAQTQTINGGTLKVHGDSLSYQATIGNNASAGTVGQLIHYTNQAENEINTTSIKFNKANLGARIEFEPYTDDVKEKETSLLNGRVITYSDEDKEISYLATEKLFQTETISKDMLPKFKVTRPFTNESGNIISFKNASVEFDENIGNTGAIYEFHNAVLLSNTVQNNIVSNNMRFDENGKEYRLSKVSVSPDSELDIQTNKINVSELTFEKNTVLKISLTNLNKHGSLLFDEIKGTDNVSLLLDFKNGLNQEEGLYQLFSKDTDFTIPENKLFNIKDLENGAYEVSKKTSENLMKDFDMTISQSKVTVALIDSESSHDSFTKMQSEMLEALQSEDKATVEKAKEALTALSGRSTSLYQSQTTAGFTQLHNVVSQMLMNTAAPVFGHNGGEEPARASVYVKGLYDRVNSLTGDGFRMRSKGAVLGVQSALTEDLTVGVGYAGVDTTAKEPLRRTEVKTNTGFISAQYQPNNWWVSGVVTYSRSQYDEEKQVLSSTGKANYDVDSLGAQITTGYNIKKGKVIVTPEVGIRYLNAKQEGYTDTLGTTVQGTNSDFVTTMAGFKVGANLGWVRPLAGVMVGYDVITDDISSVNTLANGSTYTINGKALDRLSTTVVAGFGMDLGENATLKLEYNGNYRKEYLDHSGMIRLEMKF